MRAVAEGFLTTRASLDLVAARKNGGVNSARVRDAAALSGQTSIRRYRGDAVAATCRLRNN